MRKNSLEVDIQEKMENLATMQGLLDLSAEVEAIKTILYKNNIATEEEINDAKNRCIEEAGIKEIIDSIDKKLTVYKEFQNNPSDYINNHMDVLVDGIMKSDTSLTKEDATDYFKFLASLYDVKTADDFTSTFSGTDAVSSLFRNLFTLS